MGIDSILFNSNKNHMLQTYRQTSRFLSLAPSFLRFECTNLGSGSGPHIVQGISKSVEQKLKRHCFNLQGVGLPVGLKMSTAKPFVAMSGSPSSTSPTSSPFENTNVPGDTKGDQKPVVPYVDQATAQSIDQDLMGYLGFSVDQLMELAGLSVASSVAAEYALGVGFSRILVLVGPGNNGGDGLVAARHLHHFGYKVTVCYPKRTDKPLYRNLVLQCEALGIQFVEAETLVQEPLSRYADVVIDALFGFSFKGKPRPPFDSLIQAMVADSSPPVVSVDVPSGWDVEKGDVENVGLKPDMLVSLTAPKKCASEFDGRYHYLGGRFVPPEVLSKYGLIIPEYPGSAQCVRIGGNAATAPFCVADMRLSYGANRIALDENTVSSNPWKQFTAWFEQAAECTDIREPNAMALATADSSGSPSLRMVLLKGFSPEGLVWYTNYNSTKGNQLDQNNKAAITFWWEAMERQVRFEGTVTRVSDQESDRYWNSRPWGHQVGAIASIQSSVVPGGREELESWLENAEKRYPENGNPVPRPSHWGGYRLIPEIIEFWQGGKSRLHDRIRYTRDGASWKIDRLSP